MKFNELIKNIDVIDKAGNVDIDVSNIAYHTKDVINGTCFVAIKGNMVDGHDYVEMAIERGAVAVVSSKRLELPHDIGSIIVSNPRHALAAMSARFYNNPSKELRLVGITGTNGKTTITYLLESIWKSCGYTPGVVGTVNYRYKDVLTNPRHTTPESLELQRLFSNMLSNGVSHVAMEVSSHSLDQGRIYGCQFDGGIFTNLTQDHLDYHLNMERYKEAKAKMFNEHLKNSSKENVWAVINIDDPFGSRLAGALPYKVFGYSVGKDADVTAGDVKYSLGGVALTVTAGNESVRIKSHLIGKHNASNITGSAAAAYALGAGLKEIKDGVEKLKCVPGRLEPVPNSKKLNVLVDYAHTPDAIRNVTNALKELKPKRLITVFGCGGDRDKTKRPLMGFEAAVGSDTLIITSDNPRSEDPRKIIDEIITGVKKAGFEEGLKNSGYTVEINRRSAIAKAVEIAGPEDVVLIAGKGHEDYQIIGTEKIHFDDVGVVGEVLGQKSLKPQIPACHPILNMKAGRPNPK